MSQNEGNVICVRRGRWIGWLSLLGGLRFDVVVVVVVVVGGGGVVVGVDVVVECVIY